MSLPDSATLTPALSSASRQGLTKTLTIDVRGRRSERRLGVLALLAVAAAASLLGLPPATAALFFTVVSIILIAGLWWHGWLGGAHQLSSISRLSDGSWLLEAAGLASIHATLLPDSRVGSRWLWLRWRQAGGGIRGPLRRSMLILQGDVTGRDLRRLSVRLRLESVFRQQIPTRLSVRDDVF